MSRFNMFAVPIDCPRCGKSAQAAFQADIGDLQYNTFKIGDDVFISSPDQRWETLLSPAPDLKGKSFWALGIDRCPRCGDELWAKIRIRLGRFDGVDVLPGEAAPDPMEAWGLL